MQLTLTIATPAELRSEIVDLLRHLAQKDAEHARGCARKALAREYQSRAAALRDAAETIEAIQLEARTS